MTTNSKRTFSNRSMAMYSHLESSDGKEDSRLNSLRKDAFMQSLSSRDQRELAQFFTDYFCGSDDDTSGID